MEDYLRKKPCSHDQRILMPSGRPVFAQIGAADVPKQITSMSISCDGKDAPFFGRAAKIQELNDACATVSICPYPLHQAIRDQPTAAPSITQPGASTHKRQKHVDHSQTSAPQSKNSPQPSNGQKHQQKQAQQSAPSLAEQKQAVAATAYGSASRTEFLALHAFCAAKQSIAALQRVPRQRQGRR